jgi:hypothetical protein
MFHNIDTDLMPKGMTGLTCYQHMYEPVVFSDNVLCYYVVLCTLTAGERDTTFHSL